MHDTSFRTPWHIHICVHVVVAGRARTRKRWRNVSALARRGKGFRFAPAGRGGVERSWGVKEAEEEEEEDRSPGVDRRSERIEREAIRECLMPRTKLCNYLYVRLRPSWLARVRALGCMCDAIPVSLWRCVAHLHTHNPSVRPRVYARAKKHAIAHTLLANVRIHMHERPRVRSRMCTRICRGYTTVCISRPKPTSGIYHGLSPIMPLPTTTSNETRQTMPRLLEYNDYYHLLRE